LLRWQWNSLALLVTYPLLTDSWMRTEQGTW